MKTDLEILEEIRKDFIAKFDNDPQINLVCKMMINEFKQRKEQYAINGVSQRSELLKAYEQFKKTYPLVELEEPEWQIDKFMSLL